MSDRIAIKKYAAGGIHPFFPAKAQAFSFNAVFWLADTVPYLVCAPTRLYEAYIATAVLEFIRVASCGTTNNCQR